MKVVELLACDDLSNEIVTSSALTVTEASIKSLSDVMEFVIVACATVPAAEHIDVTSNICTLPSLLSRVMSVLAPLYPVLLNCTIDAVVPNDEISPPSTLAESNSTNDAVESKTVRSSAFHPTS